MFLQLVYISLLLTVVQAGLDTDQDHALIKRLAEYSFADDCDDTVSATKVETSESTGLSFHCSVSSTKEVTSVHHLTAVDIQVVAAMGDSVTAGNGAGSNNISDALTEYRDLSFSAGGRETLETMVTLPNILKKFNPSLKGFSTDKIGFNVAESGATANDLVCQAGELIDIMKADPFVDYTNDWKVLTIFIGANDLCKCCLYMDTLSPEKHVSAMKEALDLLMNEMPRTLVNIVAPPDVSGLSQIASQNAVCTSIYMRACPCVAGGGVLVETVKESSAVYQKLLTELLETGDYESNDFAVVLQPFLQETSLPLNTDGSIDMSIFSADCIHLSKKGHALAGLALWQNMFEITSDKSLSLQSALDFMSEMSLTGQTLPCHSEQPVFTTYTNSNPISAEAVDANAADSDSSSAFSSSSLIIGIVVVASLVCIVSVIAGALIFRRAKSRHGYSEPDGQPMSSTTSTMSYTKFS